MSDFLFLFDFSGLQLRILLWPLLFGLGAYLLLTAQPLGRPKSDLTERLRRLDVDERIRAELGRHDMRPIFASRLLEGMLRPVLDDAGRFVRAVLGRFGLGGGEELERRLRITRPGVESVQFFGEKVVAGLIGFGLFPLMNGLGIHPFGVWPVWLWLAGFVAGFLAPNWQLDRRLAARRTLVVMELPIILDMLTIATSAGLALEQALGLVARQSEGTVAGELQRAVRELALGQGSVIEVLESVAERNAIPELARAIGQLRAAHEQGIPLVQALSAQAEALREQKRLRIVEEGGKASVRMILPVAVFILPALFVVLLVPAALELLHLGG
ncbi:MAG: type II secretion system F family protein [Dehalococcoidia bacterium]